MEIINLMLAGMAIFGGISTAYFKYVEWKDKQPPRK
jgi:hypothetical protein